jgi:hypothetical protein
MDILSVRARVARARGPKLTGTIQAQIVYLRRQKYAVNVGKQLRGYCFAAEITRESAHNPVKTPPKSYFPESRLLAVTPFVRETVQRRGYARLCFLDVWNIQSS